MRLRRYKSNAQRTFPGQQSLFRCVIVTVIMRRINYDLPQIGMHVARGELYCMRCCDYFYDTDFDIERKRVRDECTGQVSQSVAAAGEKRKRGEWFCISATLFEPVDI